MQFQKIILVFLLSFLFSCQKDEMTHDSKIENPILLYKGIFEPTPAIEVSGNASIYKKMAQRYVSLDDFSISEGPDLKVYLSTSNTPETFINLGDLTSATIYTIPENIDLNVYTYVLIHCETYNHLYAIALLEE